MTLPVELASIFRSKQNSYILVLIQSILDEYKDFQTRFLPLDHVAKRFLSYYQKSAVESGKIDSPPKGVASSWTAFTLSQTRTLIKTLLEALAAILDVTTETVTFKPHVWDKLNDEVVQELYEYAQTELVSYNSQLDTFPTLSLHKTLTHILNSYTEAKTQSFAGHPLGKLIRNSIPEYLQALPFLDGHYKVQGSIGQGNWANIPWIAVMDKRITATTQQGEYIVYLFVEDMSAVYLTLNQGVTVPIREQGRRDGYLYLEQKVEEMRELLPLQNLQKDDDIQLTSSGLGRDYQVSTVAYVRYDRDNIPDDEQLLADLANLLDNYKLYADRIASDHSSEDQQHVTEEQLIPQEEGTESLDILMVSERINHIKMYIQNEGFHFPEGWIENLYLSLKTKPFVILAGVSGTGKTQLVRLFAEALGARSGNDQFALIPVRPDWSDPSDLLGYKDLTGIFRPGRLTKVLVEASKPGNQNKPYFICLDEMNLARVEHYFSDVLSIIETKKWKGDRITTDPLIHKETLATDDQLIYGHLSLPDNVYVIGTVNMDETTYPFSKKVLDRANTIEFNYIDLMQFPEEQVETLDDPVVKQAPNSFLRSEYLQLKDAYGENQDLVKDTTTKLVNVNEILEQIHSHVGFRIRDAVCFYMIYNERFGLLSEDEAFDLQLLQKILPRVQGSSSSVKRVLLLLMQEALGERLSVNALLDDASEIYMKWAMSEQVKTAKYPLSARKLAFMLRRLEEDGFTSYWLT